MDQICLNKTITLIPGKVINITIGDQKEYFETQSEVKIKGDIYIDIFINNENENKTQHEVEPLDLTLSRSKYNLKNVELKIYDYQYEIKDNQCNIKIIYQIYGDDISLEKFCSLDDDNLAYQLRDYLNLNVKPNRCLNLDDDNVKIIDPVIIDTTEEVKLDEQIIQEKTLANNELKADSKEEITIPIESKNEEKKELFKESYKTSFIYYRMKDNDTIAEISKRFNVSEEKLLEVNKKDLKPDCLILIPYV